MLTFQLPARVENVYSVLCDQCEPRYRTHEQAARVAWRIVKDWIEAQIAIVEAEQAEVAEVFLPYMQNTRTGKPLYKMLRDTNFQFLLEGPGNVD